MITTTGNDNTTNNNYDDVDTNTDNNHLPQELSIDDRIIVEVASVGDNRRLNTPENEGDYNSNVNSLPNSSDNMNSNNENYNSMDDGNNRIMRLWKESPFAVGLTYPTWKDEPATCISCCFPENNDDNDNHDTCFSRILNYNYDDNNNNNHNNDDARFLSRRIKKNSSTAGFTAFFFRWIPCVGRVGNMIILFQTIPSPNNLENGIIGGDDIRRSSRPVLHCVAGPYWMVLVCITLPLIFGLSTVVATTSIANCHWMVIATWSFCNVMLLVSLLNVSCRDPGILYRYTEIPQVQQQQSNYNNNGNTAVQENWVWNDQALTYRPKSALYDNDCAVIIDGFDHVCPWTGTAIGKKNMFWFRLFVPFVFITILYDVFILYIYISPQNIGTIGLNR